MTKVALDSSVVIAILRSESGAEEAARHVRGSLISTVNLAEVFYITDSQGADRAWVERGIAAMQFKEVPFDREQASILASIYPRTLGSSVGFADRACMALAFQHGLPALTGDHTWLQHDLGIEVRLFRSRDAA